MGGGGLIPQFTIYIITDKSKKSQSEELEGCWTRWTAKTLDNDVYLLP